MTTLILIGDTRSACTTLMFGVYVSFAGAIFCALLGVRQWCRERKRKQRFLS